MAFAANRPVPPVGVPVTGGTAAVLEEKRFRIFPGRRIGRFVTSIAVPYRPVRAAEQITGVGMIEIFYFPLYQALIFSPVLLVTGFAIFLFVPVITVARFYAPGQFFVAGEAVYVFRLFAAGMAIATALLARQVPVGFAELARGLCLPGTLPGVRD